MRQNCFVKRFVFYSLKQNSQTIPLNIFLLFFFPSLLNYFFYIIVIKCLKTSNSAVLNVLANLIHKDAQKMRNV